VVTIELREGAPWRKLHFRPERQREKERFEGDKGVQRMRG